MDVGSGTIGDEEVHYFILKKHQSICPANSFVSSVGF